MAKSKLESRVDEIVQEQVDQVDEALEKVNNLIARYEPLLAKRNQLQAARRALLGGSRTTGEGGTKLRQEDIIAFLKEHPGSTPSEIAEKFNVAQPTVSSHFYRNKDRFLKEEAPPRREPRREDESVAGRTVR
jgi:DNA-binding transcriptional ArsR family regulator